MSTDKLFRDEITGIHCEATPLTGYVRIPNDHPWYGLNYDQINGWFNPQVHGGLTYGRLSDAGEHWVGFDFQHSGDYGITIDRIEQECRILAQIVAEARDGE